MRGFFASTILAILLAAVVAAPTLAETYKFELNRESNINGVVLEAGRYKLEVNENGEAAVYNGKDLVTQARVELKPRPKHVQAGSVVTDRDGNLVELRTKKHVIVFLR